MVRHMKATITQIESVVTPSGNSGGKNTKRGKKRYSDSLPRSIPWKLVCLRGTALRIGIGFKQSAGR